MSGESRGSIGFFATYRPPVPFDLYSCPINPTSKKDEICLTDGASYNYNGQAIPKEALKKMLERPKLRSEATVKDVDDGNVTGLMFVSERSNNLETLHIALVFKKKTPKVKIFGFSDVYDLPNEARMEDIGGFTGDHHIVYINTKEQPDPQKRRRQPWTALYRTNLKDGTTTRVFSTPSTKKIADLNPAVSPSGDKVAVASFQGKDEDLWDGAIEDLQTNIFIIRNVTKRVGVTRRFMIKNGGWPSWGSDNVLFFHRRDPPKANDPKDKVYYWGVYKAVLGNDRSSTTITRITPEGFDAMTPFAISDTQVVVATIRKKLTAGDENRVPGQYRHIEIFDTTPGQAAIQITQKFRPMADHYNPFIIVDDEGNKRIGYHRTKSEFLESEEDIPRDSAKMLSPLPETGLFRVSGVFPTFSTDGSKLAFIDNEFKNVWIADSEGVRPVYKLNKTNSFFAPVWNANPEKDILYLCMGPAFTFGEVVDIYAIPNVSLGDQEAVLLTNGHNNAFPFTNPDGSKLVFRSTRDGGAKRYKNLYIMDDADLGEFEGGTITRLTKGDWTDTHCVWSPQGDWIIFSSTRDKPASAPEFDNGLDPGYYSVYLLKVDAPDVVVRVARSGLDGAGHNNHPFFSPDLKSIVFVSDVAAISADPISMPIFIHSVRAYGDIFTIDVDLDDIEKKIKQAKKGKLELDIKEYTRVTHSRFENSTAVWNMFATTDMNVAWNKILKDQPYPPPVCPYAQRNYDRPESVDMLGHLTLPKRCC